MWYLSIFMVAIFPDMYTFIILYVDVHIIVYENVLIYDNLI